MGMSVTFYNLTDDANVVNKTNKTLVNTFNCDVYDDQDIETPSFLLPSTANLNINYCYVANFGRYYFCKVRQLKDGRRIVECEVDALTTFWNDFKGSPCIANRSASNYNKEITDDEILREPTMSVYSEALHNNSVFKNGASEYRVVLTMAGRDDNEVN